MPDPSPNPAPNPNPAAKPRSRFAMRADSLEALVGAHPAALRDLYLDGTPADPAELRGQPHGRLLALESLQAAHLLTRPLVVAAARHLLPWRGKTFDQTGAGGRNRIFQLELLPFRCERGPSRIDGQDTLVLRYDGLGNLWPLTRVVDELRKVGPRVAVGPASLYTAFGSPLLIWWGLELC